jgi:hypothetical protein
MIPTSVLSAALAAPTLTVGQVMPTGAWLFWRVKVLAPSELYSVPEFTGIMAGNVDVAFQKAMGVEPGEDPSKAGEVNLSRAAKLLALNLKVANLLVTHVELGGDAQPVSFVGSREEENAEEGKIFVGILELGMTGTGEPVLSAILSAALSGLRGAGERLNTFRGNSG